MAVVPGIVRSCFQVLGRQCDVFNGEASWLDLWDVPGEACLWLWHAGASRKYGRTR
jgi:hypothetical protein